MDKREASKVAKALQARFEVYFRNRFWTKCGKHWKQITDSPDQLAQNTIKASCRATRAVDSTPATYAFRFLVEAESPNFVYPRFSVTELRKEINQFFEDELTLISDNVDFTNSQLQFAFKRKNSKQFYHFEFIQGW